MIQNLQNPDWWVSLLQIIGIDIILSGDNAVVIALACRSLPKEQQRWGIILGAGAAIGLRVVFATFIVYVLAVPYLKFAGSLLLFWIAVKLLLPEQQEAHATVGARSNLFGAIRTIVIADAVMSLDNVIGIAAAARGHIDLLVIGLLISIPLIVYGSTLILKLLQRFPVIVTLGAALLGYIAGEVGATDPVIHAWAQDHLPALDTIAPIAGAVIVVLAGKWLARKAKKSVQQADLASSE